MHQADQDGVGADRAAQIIGINVAVAVDRQPGDARTETLEKAQRGVDRRMLNGAADQVRRPWSIGWIARVKDALEREIVGLRSAAGEDDLVRGAAKQRVHIRTRCLDQGPCRHSSPMRAGGIAETVAERRLHRRNHLRRKRCAGIVVEVDHLGASRALAPLRAPRGILAFRAGTRSWSTCLRQSQRLILRRPPAPVPDRPSARSDLRGRSRGGSSHR